MLRVRKSNSHNFVRLPNSIHGLSSIEFDFRTFDLLCREILEIETDLIKLIIHVYFFISAAFGIKCYICTSLTSMDDCNKNKKELDCGSNYDRCGTGTVEIKVASKVESKSYSKACTTKITCEGGPFTDCCDSDLCNGGAAPMISVLLMVACSFVAFFR